MAFKARKNGFMKSKGSVPLTLRQNRGLFDYWQSFGRHATDDVIGISMGERSRGRAAPGHAVAARIVDDDQFNTACLSGLSRNAGAGAIVNDRDACGYHAMQAGQDSGAGNAGLASSNDRIVEIEATFKAALRLPLQQWAQSKPGTPVVGPQFHRCHRIDLLEKAFAPMHEKLTPVQFSGLAKALSLAFGIQMILVLKDIWKVVIDEMLDVATWTVRALVRVALAEEKIGLPAQA